MIALVGSLGSGPRARPWGRAPGSGIGLSLHERDSSAPDEPGDAPDQAGGGGVVLGLVEVADQVHRGEGVDLEVGVVEDVLLALAGARRWGGRELVLALTRGGGRPGGALDVGGGERGELDRVLVAEVQAAAAHQVDARVAGA